MFALAAARFSSRRVGSRYVAVPLSVLIHSFTLVIRAGAVAAGQ